VKALFKRNVAVCCTRPLVRALPWPSSIKLNINQGRGQSNQKQSKAITPNQKQSKAIKSNQKQSKAIKSNQKQSKAIKSNQTQSHRKHR
jgi:hypothetical protein